MESPSDYLSRSMGQFNSAKTAKVIKESDLINKQVKSEWAQQLQFCRWLKQTFPGIMYESDLSSGGARTKMMQNLILTLKSQDSFPDVTIYHPSCAYIGCKIEMKALDASPFLKDGSLSTQEHVQDQHRCHEKLRAQGWFVSFATGAEEAKKVFLEYYNK